MQSSKVLCRSRLTPVSISNLKSGIKGNTNIQYTSWTSRAFQRIGSAAKTSLALVGFGSLSYIAYEYNQLKQVIDDKKTSDNPTKLKRALVLPFHRMRIVEQKKKRSIGNLLSSLSSNAYVDDSDRPIDIDVKELVDIIRSAAEDPEIVALYGTFGQGFGFNCGGYAHIEEIRDAIRVFNEQGQDEDLNEKNNFSQKKFSYAFADTFDRPMDSGNMEYFLASSFTHLHMQPRGNMNLFGVSASNLFIRDALKKYGIEAHVFKQGKFKNAPNFFSDNKYTRAHFQNTKSLIQSINKHVCDSIVTSRNLQNAYTSHTWRDIFNYGTMTSEEARELGLIDYITSINPFRDLILSSECDKNLKEMDKKWNGTLDFANFRATEAINLSQYRSLLTKRKKLRESKWRWHSRLQNAAKKSVAFESLLETFGYNAPNFNIDLYDYEKYKGEHTQEKVAVLYITGAINDDTAQTVTKSLRKIKEDKNIKCVVIRVDSPGGSVVASELILEECKNVMKPCIASFGNVAASGGYYVSMNSEKIFALPTTITGSIGVFGIKFDITKFLKQYGVYADSVKLGNHALTESLYQPLNRSMRSNLQKNVGKYYDYFKLLVSSGRKMPLRDVEAVAQGRIWTGKQSLMTGLVDALGGLHTAIDYAIMNHTSTGHAVVETWPKQLTTREKFEKILKEYDGNDAHDSLFGLFVNEFIMPITFETKNRDSSTPILNQEMFGLLAGATKSTELSCLKSWPVDRICTNYMYTIDETEAISMVIQNSNK